MSLNRFSHDPFYFSLPKILYNLKYFISQQPWRRHTFLSLKTEVSKATAFLQCTLQCIIVVVLTRRISSDRLISLLQRICRCRPECELRAQPELPQLSRFVTHRPLNASWCVIRIRIRMPSQSTQTEVNEHVCLQWDVSLSEPAWTHLEGNCWGWPLYIFLTYLCIYLKEYFSFKASLSRYSWGRINVSVLLDVLCRDDIAWCHMKDATSSW